MGRVGDGMGGREGTGGEGRAEDRRRGGRRKGNGEEGRGGDVEGPGKWSAPGNALALGGPEPEHKRNNSNNYYYYNMKIVHIGTTTKRKKNLTREKNLTTIYGGLSNTSNNEAKLVLSIKKLGRDSTFSRIRMISYHRMHFQHEQSHQNSTVHKTVV